MEFSKERLFMPQKIAKDTQKRLAEVANNALNLVGTLVDTRHISERIKAELPLHEEHLAAQELDVVHKVSGPDGKAERLEPCRIVIRKVARQLVNQIKNSEPFLEDRLVAFKDLYNGFIDEYPNENVENLSLDDEEITVLKSIGLV